MWAAIVGSILSTWVRQFQVGLTFYLAGTDIFPQKLNKLFDEYHQKKHGILKADLVNVLHTWSEFLFPRLQVAQNNSRV